MNTIKRTSAFALGLAMLCSSAAAWGPTTELSVVTTAVQVLSQDGAIPLLKLDRYVWQGARISSDRQLEMFPNFTVDPISTIEREMDLLQSVKGSRVDPYYAFRLGVLGKLVSQVTAPLANASPVYRDLYFADVDKHIQRTKMRQSKRRHVDPQAYFARAIQAARAREVTIEKDYQSGIGYSGLARAALPEDASRSVAAVADVWYTILLGSLAYPSVSRNHIEHYTLDALAFYLENKKMAEANEVYERALKLGKLAPEFRERMGDLFIDAEEFERGMAEYLAVLETDPTRRDVSEKIGRYYTRVGRDALEEELLEQARRAFTAALKADMLQPDAQGELLKVQRLITERNGRLALAKQAIGEGNELETKAERAALNGDYAQAIGNLREAETLYRQVSDEFPAEFARARRSLGDVEPRMRALMTDLINNAQVLSGSGFSFDARRLAESVQGLEEQALRAMVQSEFQGAAKKLADTLPVPLSRP